MNIVRRLTCPTMTGLAISPSAAKTTTIVVIMAAKDVKTINKVQAYLNWMKISENRVDDGPT